MTAPVSSLPNFKQEHKDNIYLIIDKTFDTFSTIHKNKNLAIEKKISDYKLLFNVVLKMFLDILKLNKDLRTIRLDDNSLYYGQVVNHLPHGIGKSILSTKNTTNFYIGLWINGNKNTFGLHETTELYSIGAIHNNKKNGYNYVHYKNNNPDNFSLICSNFINNNLNGNAYIVYQDNSCYNGPISELEKHSISELEKHSISELEKHSKGVLYLSQNTQISIKLMCTSTKNSIKKTTFCCDDGRLITTCLSPWEKSAKNLCKINYKKYKHTNPYSIELLDKSTYTGECRPLTDLILFSYLDYYNSISSPNKYNVKNNQIITRSASKITKKNKLVKSSNFAGKSGNENFIAHGLGVSNKNDEHYRGYFEKGLYHGYGFLTYKNNHIKYYHGEFKNNQKHGKARVLFSFKNTNLAISMLTDDCAIPFSFKHNSLLSSTETSGIYKKNYKTTFTNNKYNFYETNNETVNLSPTYTYASVNCHNDNIDKVYNFIEVDNFLPNKTLALDKTGSHIYLRR